MTNEQPASLRNSTTPEYAIHDARAAGQGGKLGTSMLRLLSIASVLSAAAACGSVSPLFCDDDTPCTDPARPFCDLQGIHPASEGIGKTCIPDPFATPDAGPGGDAAGGADASPTACEPRIAYHESGLGGDNDVLLMSATGFQLGSVTENDDVFARVSSWSPDGLKLALTISQLQNSRPAIKNLVTDELFEFPIGAGNTPLFSPAGDRLVYQTVDDQPIPRPQSLVVSDLGGNVLMTIPSDAQIRNQSASWAPDGTQLVFERTPAQVFRVNVNGSGLSNLSNSVDEDRAAQWSPTQQEIVFTRNEVGRTDRNIVLMNADGSNQRLLTTDTAVDEQPHWSPDGSRIAFVSSRDGEREIYIINRDGTGLVRATNTTFGATSPRWSTDGRFISFLRRTAATGSANDFVTLDVESGVVAGPHVDNSFSPGFWEPCR